MSNLSFLFIVALAIFFLILFYFYNAEAIVRGLQWLSIALWMISLYLLSIATTPATMIISIISKTEIMISKNMSMFDKLSFGGGVVIFLDIGNDFFFTKSNFEDLSDYFRFVFKLYNCLAHLGQTAVSNLPKVAMLRL